MPKAPFLGIGQHLGKAPGHSAQRCKARVKVRHPDSLGNRMSPPKTDGQAVKLEPRISRRSTNSTGHENLRRSGSPATTQAGHPHLAKGAAAPHLLPYQCLSLSISGLKILPPFSPDTIRENSSSSWLKISLRSRIALDLRMAVASWAKWGLSSFPAMSKTMGRGQGG